jgi:hypothetical protein
MATVDRYAALKNALVDADLALGGGVTIDPLKSQAENFEAYAKGKSWFVKAEMNRPLGGLRRGGRVVRREQQLEITVRKGGEAEAQKLLDLFQYDGVIRTMHSVPHGGRKHG